MKTQPIVNPKSFLDQLIECNNEGMTADGEFMKFREHPEFLPHPFTKAALAIAEELETNPEAGLQLTACLRFGGTCSSGHPECKKMRGFVVC